MASLSSFRYDEYLERELRRARKQLRRAVARYDQRVGHPPWRWRGIARDLALRDAHVWVTQVSYRAALARLARPEGRR